MGGEDVKVTIGANATPYQVAMAKVRVTAQQTGASLGLEFDKGAYRAEERVKRGMDGILKSLATAKDPISAIAGAIEGLGASFRIAGAAFLAVGIGNFLREELNKAAEGAQDFYKKTDSVFALASDSSKEFTEKSVKSFEEAKDAYGKEGLLEWLIYGAGQKSTLANGEAAYQSALARLHAMREAEYKADADAESANAQEQLQGQIEKVTERYDAEISKAKEAGDSIVEIERAKAGAIAKIQEDAEKKQEAEIEKGQNAIEKRAEATIKLEEANDNAPGLSEDDKQEAKKKLAQDKYQAANDKLDRTNADVFGAQERVDIAKPEQLKERQLELDALQTRQLEEQADVQTAQNAIDQLNLDIKNKQNEATAKQSELLSKSLEKSKELSDEMAEAGKTPQQKIDALKAKIATESKDVLGPLTPAMRQDNKNKITGDQIKLKNMQFERDAAVKEETKRRDSLTKEQALTQSKLATDQANTMGFHGTVSSLRREGFGKTPGGSKDGAALKSMAASEKHLEDINKSIAELNSKIGGGA